MPLPRPVNFILCAGLGAAAAGIAALAARGSWDAAAIVLAASIVVLPGLVVLVAEQPAVALGFFVAGQVLEAFEYRTPAGTVSFGVIVLGLLLLFHWRSAWGAVRADRNLVIAVILFGGWVATYALRLRYAPATSVAREVVTVLSFGAIAAAALAVARRRDVVRKVGIGAIAALLFLGACGVLASLGAIPKPHRIAGPTRELFDLSSPIERNYGLNVAFDSVALLVPLCIPWLLLGVVSRGGWRRLPPALALAAFVLSAVFVFQAREMVVQLVAVVLGAAFVLRPRAGGIVAAVGLPLLAATVVALAAVDRTSSDQRIAPARHVVTVLRDEPQRVVLGTDENRFFKESIESSPALVAATRRGNYAIHNFFLSNLVAGGIAAFVLSVLLFAVIMRRAWRMWRLKPRDPDTRAILVACGVMLVTLLLETARANAAGYWVLAGLALGLPLGRRKEPAAEPLPHPVASTMRDRLARASVPVGIALRRVMRSARQHVVPVTLPLLLAPPIVVGLVLAHSPGRTATGHVTFTDLPIERQTFGNRPLVLRTKDVRSARVSLEIHSTDRTTSVTVRATASRPREAAHRVNAYLDAYLPWHERAAVRRLRAEMILLRKQIGRLRDPRDAARREALAAQYDQLVRLSYLPIGRPSTLDRAEMPKNIRSIAAACAVALGLGLFLGLGAAAALDLLPVSYVVGESAHSGGSASAANRSAA